MRNLGFFLSLCLLSAVPALAAETNRPAAAAPDEASQIAAAEEQPVEIAAPEFNVSPELEVGATPRPECSDPRLTQKIVEKIEAYQSEHPATMLIDRRRDILLRRNLSRFGEVKVEGFTAKQDFNVANAIIMTKINRGLGQGKAADVYVLVYPVGEGNVADIINFLPEGTGDGILSFIYD